jgi:ClpP class serine protease
MPEFRRYSRTGMQAIAPRAFFEMFGGFGECAAEIINGVAVVEIMTPLCNIHDGFWDTYDSIRSRCQLAFDNPEARAVLLRIDSPGGDVAGCFDLARWITAAATMTGKSVYAHIEGCGCSAAYALASAASQVYCADTAIVGSIGVLSTRLDLTAMNTAMGVAVILTTSGAHKADGSPDVPMTAEEAAREQALVNELAAVFFGWVQERRGVDAQPLQAGVLVGASAKSVGLVDDVMSYDQALTLAATGTVPVPPKSGDVAEDTESEDDVTVKKVTKAGDADWMAALKTAAENGDEDAIAALAKMAAPAEEPAAAADPSPDDDEEEPKKGTAASFITGLRAKAQRAERTRMLAASSLSDELKLQCVKLDLTAAQTQEVINIQKQMAKPKAAVAVSMRTPQLQRPPTQGATGAVTFLPQDEAAKMAERMGVQPKTGKKRVSKLIGGRVYLGVAEDFQPRNALTAGPGDDDGEDDEDDVAVVN